MGWECLAGVCLASASRSQAVDLDSKYPSLLVHSLAIARVVGVPKHDALVFQISSHTSHLLWLMWWVSLSMISSTRTTRCFSNHLERLFLLFTLPYSLVESTLRVILIPR